MPNTYALVSNWLCSQFYRRTHWKDAVANRLLDIRRSLQLLMGIYLRHPSQDTTSPPHFNKHAGKSLTDHGRQKKSQRCWRGTRQSAQGESAFGSHRWRATLIAKHRSARRSSRPPAMVPSNRERYEWRSVHPNSTRAADVLLEYRRLPRALGLLMFAKPKTHNRPHAKQLSISQNYWKRSFSGYLLKGS